MNITKQNYKLLQIVKLKTFKNENKSRNHNHAYMHMRYGFKIKPLIKYVINESYIIQWILYHIK